MLRVIHANQLEALAEALAEALPAGDPFATTTIVVPSRLVSRWLWYALAQRRGVACALEMPFLETFLAEALAPPGHDAAFRAVDRPQLAALLASVLASPAVAAPELAEVAAYLGDGDDEAQPVRREQLASRLAQLYWDYALTRGDWLEQWEGPPTPGIPAPRGAQAGNWQAELWRRLRAHAPHAIPVPCLLAARRRAGLAPPAQPPIHVFGFSYLAPSYLQALAELATTTEVTCYVVDPCAELWTDVAGRRGADEEVTRLLSLWARPGRDTLSSLIDLSSGNLEDRFVEPARTTALGSLLADLLRRSEVPPTAAAEAGVAVLACPSMTRELEVVALEIRARLAADPTLRACDVAVLIAGDPDGYWALAPAIFERHQLPYSTVGLATSDPSRIDEATLLLLELPLGAFTRPEMLRVMTHPAVLARHPHVDPDDWVRWTERLAIVHGADQRDHQGSYLEAEDSFHWDQGVRRLALGAFMSSERSGDPRAAHDPHLPEELDSGQLPSAATFALLTRSLIADARWLATATLPLAHWGEKLDAMVGYYLAAEDDGAARELARIRRTLGAIADLDLDGRSVPYREVVELARRRLGSARYDRGEPLTSGVLLAPLAPMQPIPFRHVFCVGLGEPRFPARDARSPLDGRDQVRRGDVSPRERDRYAFLELLLSCRDRLTLSYVGKDLRSGEDIDPSSVVFELVEALAPHLGAASARAAREMIETAPRLHAWDDDGKERRPAGREAWAIDARRQLVEHLTAQGRAIPAPAALAAALARHPTIGPELHLDRRGRVARPAPAEVLRLPLTALRKFLESPVQAWAETVLGLEALDDEDAFEVAEEPLDDRQLDRAMLFRATLDTYFRRDGQPAISLEAAHQQHLAEIRRRGRAPLGVFGDGAIRRDLVQLRAWRDELGDARWHRWSFGRINGALGERCPAIPLEIEVGGATRRVELYGQTELVSDRHGSVVLALHKVDLRHHLRGMIDHLALAAAGIKDEHHHLVLAGDKSEAVEHLPWTSDDARSYLRDLAADLLGQSHAYLLPPKYAVALASKGQAALPRGRGPQGALGFGPLTDDDDLDAPAKADRDAMVARRWRPLVQRMPSLGGRR